MSREIVVSKRYASALFEVAKEGQLLQQMEEELRVVKQTFIENSEFASLLAYPKLGPEKKHKMVLEVFAECLQVIQNTLLFLIDRHRIDIIVEIVNEFLELANSYHNVAEAIVYSVRPLNEDEISRISEVFAKKVERGTLSIQNNIQPDLLGGIRVRIGNRIFDGSVSKKLEILQRQLLG